MAVFGFFGIFSPRALCIGTSLAAFGASAAQAQIPASVDPGKVEQRLTPAETALPRSVRPAGTSHVSAPPQAALPQAKIAPFTLKQVAVEGTTIYKAEQIRALYADAVGSEIGNAEAQAIAQKITQQYRKDGYILSQAMVTGQDPATGTLLIRVIEGFISNVIIEGEVRQQSGDRYLIEAMAERVKRERPFNINTLERYLLLYDDLPGAAARGIVRPSADTFGASDLVITMTHKLWEGSASTNNRGSKYIGPFQHSVTLAANSLLRVYERTLLRYVTSSPMDELQFYQLQHEETMDEVGTKLNFDLSQTYTQPSVRPALPDIDGRSSFLQARLSRPFIRSRKENLTARATLDYRNSKTDLFDLPFSEDRITALRGGLTYDFADRFSGVNLIDVEISRSMPWFNPSTQGLDRSRPDADAAFTKLNFDASRIHPLPHGFSVLTAATGQYSFNKLLSAEQFAIGGMNFGQAYDPAELAGDHGLAGKLELRYGQEIGKPYFDSYQLFGYYDIGAIWNRGVSGDDRRSLASTGFGTRVNFSTWLSGTAELGFPLTRKVAAENDRDPRFFFSVTGRF